ncbi:MAG: hypothetical protein ABIF71_08095 [Planctomycetota bacterium]
MIRRIILGLALAALLGAACGPVTVNRPSVSSNRKLAFALDHKGRYTFLPESLDRGIYLTDIFGNFLTPLAGMDRLCGWCEFAPSNDMILFVEKEIRDDGEDRYLLKVFNLKTEEEEVEFISTRFIWFPSWSPNGKYIAFCGEGRNEITVVNWRDNQVAYRVPTNAVFYRWLPDATGFLTMEVLDEIDAMEGGTLQYFVIRRVDFEKNEPPEDLVRGYSRACWPDLSDDGTKIVFNAVEFSGPSSFLIDKIEGRENVYLYDCATRAVTRLTKSGINAFYAVLSPDASTVAFIDYDQDPLNGGDVWTCDLNDPTRRLRKVWGKGDAVYPFWVENGILGYIVMDKSDKIRKGFDNIIIHNLANDSQVPLRKRIEELFKPAGPPAE